MCESNKEFWENTTIKEFIIEWVINRATASLSLLNTSGSVAMDRYQWLSNMYAWHYMHAFTDSHTDCVNQQGHHQWHNYLRNSQWSLLSQRANQWYLLRMNGNKHHNCLWRYVWVYSVAGGYNGWWWGNMLCLPLNVNPNSLICTLQNSRANLMKYSKIRYCHWCINMNSDVIQQWRTHI